VSNVSTVGSRKGRGKKERGKEGREEKEREGENVPT